MKVCIVNDTSGFNHFGCDAVIDTIKAEFAKRDVTVLGTVRTGIHWIRESDLLRKSDLVIVNGEGSIHHDKFSSLVNIAESYPCALINAVFQEMRQNDNLQKFKYISVRESLSQKDMELHGVTPNIVPDLIFASGMKRADVTGDTVVVDSICQSYGISPHLPNSAELIGKSKRMVTGRFHGACLALMWGMPFSAYPSNTHKTKGMLIDAGCPHLYFETQEDAMDNIQEYDGSEYVSKAQASINGMFDTLCSF